MNGGEREGGGREGNGHLIGHLLLKSPPLVTWDKRWPILSPHPKWDVRSGRDLVDNLNIADMSGQRQTDSIANYAHNMTHKDNIKTKRSCLPYKYAH